MQQTLHRASATAFTAESLLPSTRLKERAEQARFAVIKVAGLTLLLLLVGAGLYVRGSRRRDT
jgi:hypothetical protein